MFGRNILKLTSSTRTVLNNKFYKNATLHPVQLRNWNRLVANTAALECKVTDRVEKPVSKQESNKTDSPKFKSAQKPKATSKTAQNEDILEKMIAGLSSDIHQKNRVYKNDLLRVINKVQEINYSSKKQGLLLIRCCADLLPDESTASRMSLVDLVWKSLKQHTSFEVDHYNELLKVYIANNRTLTARSFINQMSPVTPNITTYELILRALGEVGDINQATEVIANMKNKSIPATENIFNSLVICEGKARNLKNIDEVLSMMKSLKLEPSIETITAKVRGLAWNLQHTQMINEMEMARKKGFQFGERHIMEIVKTLADVAAYTPIAQVLKFLPQEILTAPSISPYMQSVATALVFQNHPIAALEIYKCLPLPAFGPKDDLGLHGRSLVRDCVKASMPSSAIGLITQELMASGRNPIAIQNACEAALQLKKIPLALDMFTRMQLLGMPLRPHYFWPILRHNSAYGEKALLETLQTMITMNVTPDYETIMDYVLPYVSFTSPQNLMKKFTDSGLTVSLVLTPMMETLLNGGQIRAASELCELFQGKVDAEKLMIPLVRGFLISSDLKSTLFALEDIVAKAQDKNKDWTGRFLCAFMKNRRVKEDLSDFMIVIKGLRLSTLRISTAAADYCLSLLPEKYTEKVAEEFKNILIEITDEKVLDEGELFNNPMPHPKQMNEESLKAHLHELEAKGMNTRGILRKLLQLYCKKGNLTAAREIAEKCQKEGVFLSAGMKAAMFDLHVKLGELDLAELALADLNKTAPNFTLDEFKVIDFATLMVYRKKMAKAFDLIHDQSKKRHIVGGRGIEMNCWRLLDATAACGDIDDARKMLELLVSLRYCKPSNVLLGPLIRVHLNKDNIDEAVHEFARLANKYNKTPLKHELLCHIMKKMSDGQTEMNFVSNEKASGRMNRLAQTVLNVDKKVHGPGDVQLTVISALADVSYTKTLRKMFLDPAVKFHPDALMRRCERFAQEKKVHALKNIADCVKDLRHIDTTVIYDLIMDVYQREDNHKDALALWIQMQESDIRPSQKFVRNFVSLLNATNKPVPAELSILLEKQANRSH